MNIIDRYFESVERISKVRTLAVLRDLPATQLRDLGISVELLDQGIAGWPWRSLEDNWQPRKSKFQKPVGAVSKVTVNGNSTVDQSKTAA
ncbi:MAG: hypothetical protein KTR32_36750 [Granulosicoccus sp.]|nr:hypothetical protein [Granulosicoccus sp.]